MKLTYDFQVKEFWRLSQKLRRQPTETDFKALQVLLGVVTNQILLRRVVALRAVTGKTTPQVA